MLKLKGLKKIAGMSKTLRGPYSDRYLQINVDLVTGEVWANEHCGHGSYTQHNDSNIMTCGYINSPKTMAEIRDLVAKAINQNITK